MAMEMGNTSYVINNDDNNDDSNNPNRRVSRGRQKVVMRKMTNESNLQVTFSKRRSGLFKKASELCTLCGLELAIIVFSPGRKVFSFGHSSVQHIIDRYLNPQNYRMTSQMNSGTLQLIEAHRNANVRDLNQQLTHLMDELDEERKRSHELRKDRKERAFLHWWEAPTETLNDLPLLEQLKSAMEMLRTDASQKADQILIQNTNSLLPPKFNSINNNNTPSFYGTVGGGAGGNGSGGQPQLPGSGSGSGSGSFFPNQGGLQPTNNYHYYNNNNNNNYNNDNNVGFDGGVANTSSVVAGAGSSIPTIPYLQARTAGGGGNHVNMPQMQAMNSGGGVVNNNVNLASGGSVNHVNLPSYGQVNNASDGVLNHANQVNLQPRTSFSPMPNMQASGPTGINYINMNTMPRMVQPNTSPALGGVNNHFNLPALPHQLQQPNTSPAPGIGNDHFNMPPLPHLPNTTSAPGNVNNHFNMSSVPNHMLQPNTTSGSGSGGGTINHVNHEWPINQGTHHVSNNNVGHGYGRGRGFF